IEKATFGAGCFWGVEEAFQQTPGVIRTQVGYSGGHKTNPTYEEVCEGDTGHVESVQVEFDNSIVGFDDLLKKFWSIHSATIDPRWREKISRQYESVVFYHSEEQRDIAERAKQELMQQKQHEVSTRIEPLRNFYR